MVGEIVMETMSPATKHIFSEVYNDTTFKVNSQGAQRDTLSSSRRAAQDTVQDETGENPAQAIDSTTI